MFFRQYQKFGEAFFVKLEKKIFSSVHVGIFSKKALFYGIYNHILSKRRIKISKKEHFTEYFKRKNTLKFVMKRGGR